MNNVLSAIQKLVEAEIIIENNEEDLDYLKYKLSSMEIAKEYINKEIIKLKEKTEGE